MLIDLVLRKIFVAKLMDNIFVKSKTNIFEIFLFVKLVFH